MSHHCVAGALSTQMTPYRMIQDAHGQESHPHQRPPEHVPAPTKGEVEYREIAEQLHRRYPGLVAALSRRAKSRALAEDLIGDAVVKLLEHTREARLTDFQNVAGYVFRIGVGLLRNHQQKLENRPALHGTAEELDDLPEPDSRDTAESDEASREVHHVLDSMRERDRRILRAAYLQEHDKQQICTDLGISNRHYDRVIWRARERMMELIMRLRTGQRRS